LGKKKDLRTEKSSQNTGGVEQKKKKMRDGQGTPHVSKKGTVKGGKAKSRVIHPKGFTDDQNLKRKQPL